MHSIEFREDGSGAQTFYVSHVTKTTLTGLYAPPHFIHSYCAVLGALQLFPWSSEGIEALGGHGYPVY